MNEYTQMNPNPLVQYLNKPASEFTRADLIRYIEDNDIEMINFRYVAWDGRLKALNFIINNKQHLEAVLSAGERVDANTALLFSIPFPKHQHLISFVRSTTGMAIILRVHPNLSLKKPTRVLKMLLVLSLKQWASWNIISSAMKKNFILR